MQKWFPNSWVDGTEFFLYGYEEINSSYYTILTSFLMASRINVFSSFRLSFILARLFFSMMGLEAWKKGPRIFSVVISVKAKTFALYVMHLNSLFLILLISPPRSFSLKILTSTREVQPVNNWIEPSLSRALKCNTYLCSCFCLW